MGIVAIVAGGIESGFNSLPTLSGTTVGPTKAFGLVAASLGVYLLPMLSIAAIGLLLSTITRNSAAAVVGALMIALVLQIGSIIPGLEEIRPYLLPRQFDAWQGLLREPTDWAPIVRAAWVCAAYAVPSLFAAYVVFLRRDVAGAETASAHALTPFTTLYRTTSSARKKTTPNRPPPPRPQSG